MSLPDLLITLSVSAAGLAAWVGWVRACRRATRAEQACEELRRSLMRGSAILHHKRPSPHKWTDADVEVIAADGKGLAFTDGVWREAREHFAKIRNELPSSFRNLQ
jgi:hypothetical protein